MLFSKQEKVKKFKTIPYVMIKILSCLSCLMFLSGFFFRSPQCADDKWTNTVLTESSNDQEIFLFPLKELHCVNNFLVHTGVCLTTGNPSSRLERKPTIIHERVTRCETRC